MATEMTPQEYVETYRGVTFRRTRKGVWLFDTIPPPGKWGHWCRYCEMHEEETAQSMRDAIDRMHNNVPCYTGDLRYRT